MHFGHPVAQGIHDHPQHDGVAEIERIAGSRDIYVIAGIGFVESIVRAIVYSPEADRGAEVIPSAVWL